MITALHSKWDEWAMACRAGDVAKLEALRTPDVFFDMEPIVMALMMDVALQHGQTHVVDWLLGFADMVRFGDHACCTGSLALAKYVHGKGAAGFDGSAFVRVCSRGWLHVAQWLRGEFGLDKASEWPGVEEAALREACEEGHLAVMQWLWSFETLDRHRQLCRGLHVKYGREQSLFSFGMSRPLFASACRQGHLHIAQWLHSQGALDVLLVLDQGTGALLASSVRVRQVYGYSVFLDTCTVGRLRVAQWLFGLGVIDIHSYDDEALRLACAEDQDCVAQWLLSLDPEYTAWPKKALRQLQSQCWTPERDAWVRSIVQRR